MLETCANCERPIGHLETPHLYNDRIVCSECRRRLDDARAVPATLPFVTRMLRNATLCPHCRQVGVHPARGLQGPLEILIALALAPTIIGTFAYYIAMDGRSYCPSCRCRV